MTGIADKIRKVIGSRSVNGWAEEHGLPPQTVHEWLKHDRMPRAAALKMLVNATGIPVEWWKFGDEEPPIHHAARQNIGTYENPSLPDGFILVPRYDVAASMGNGTVIHSEQIVDHLAFRAEWVRTELSANPKNLVLISAIGDSMEPTLRAGDLLLIDRSDAGVKQDAIYAFATNGELRVKRMQLKIDGSVVVKSDNPQYEAEFLSSDQVAMLRIVGRVVWSGRRM